MTIIALKGGKGSGKSHIGKILYDHYGYSTLAFGDKLKAISAVAFGFTQEQLYGDKKEEVDPVWGISPRDWLKWFATDVMRVSLPAAFPSYKFGDRFWIEHMLINLNSSKDVGHNIIIDDMRFINEYEALREWCLNNNATLKVLNVVRDGNDNSTDVHVSEIQRHSIPTDGIIHNDSNISEETLRMELEKYV